MVSKKRLDYGFNGYRSPSIPKAPRSVRRRGPHKELAKESKLSAFELLAALAGELLQESESFVSNNGEVRPHVCPDKNEQQLVGDKALGSEILEHRTCAASAFVPESSFQKRSSKGLLQAETYSVSEPVPSSMFPISDTGKKVDGDIKLEICEVKSGDERATSDGGGSVWVGDSFSCRTELHLNDGEGHLANILPAKDSNEEECVNTDMLINSENRIQLPLYRDPIPISLHQKCWNNIKVGIRDDDDNSYRRNGSTSKSRYIRHQPRFGHRRVRKILTSKYRKLAPKVKHYGHYNTSERMRSFHQYRKRIYTVERCHQSPVKKRKLIGQSFAVTNDQDTTSGNGASATSIGHLKPKDCRVKFRIKSFRVPELYVEVPENASIGSLKRTVMEAVTAILGSGIRVGVVLQGKKVGDDDKTLQQAGISPSSKLDSLGFMLEPSVTHDSPTATANPVPLVLPSEKDQKLPGSPATPKTISGISPSSVDPPLITKFDNDLENSEFVSSQHIPAKEIMDGEISDSMALDLVLPTNAETLAVVPVNSKPKRNELSQRRTRRPFSISEVEALVEAVERLGTGRWRDVKIGAFENADHRTYVDLKDKWKTLVHTASISSQQRRGEPVPQELLDRVLSVHSYWSSKQYGKHSIEPVKTEPDQIGSS